MLAGIKFSIQLNMSQKVFEQSLHLEWEALQVEIYFLYVPTFLELGLYIRCSSSPAS